MKRESISSATADELVSTHSSYYQPLKAQGSKARTNKSLESEKDRDSRIFLGPLQPCRSRIPTIPDVNYEKGGVDFRCPDLKQTSSLGRQILGK